MTTTHLKECLVITLGASAILVAIKAYDSWTIHPDSSSTAVQSSSPSHPQAPNEPDENSSTVPQLSEDGPPDPPTPGNGQELYPYTAPPGGAPLPGAALSPRTQNDRRRLLAGQIRREYSLSCQCDTCSPDLYFNWPWSCSGRHSLHDIVIQPRRRPELVTSGNEGGVYEALSLARCTIEYFSRSRGEMDWVQLQGWKKCRGLLHNCGWVEALKMDDPRESAVDVSPQELADALNKLFFFDAIRNVSVDWETAELDKPENFATLGHTTTYLDKGIKRSVVELHPTRLSECISGQREMRLAEQRLGTMLHDMLHAFLMQYTCLHCSFAAKSHHGREWQRISKAIEEQSLRVLGIEVDLGRLAAMWDDMDKYELRPSMHDLEDWGFLQSSVVR